MEQLAPAVFVLALGASAGVFVDRVQSAWERSRYDNFRLRYTLRTGRIPSSLRLQRSTRCTGRWQEWLVSWLSALRVAWMMNR